MKKIISFLFVFIFSLSTIACSKVQVTGEQILDATTINEYFDQIEIKDAFSYKFKVTYRMEHKTTEEEQEESYTASGVVNMNEEGVLSAEYQIKYKAREITPSLSGRVKKIEKTTEKGIMPDKQEIYINVKTKNKYVGKSFRGKETNEEFTTSIDDSLFVEISEEISVIKLLQEIKVTALKGGFFKSKNTVKIVDSKIDIQQIVTIKTKGTKITQIVITEQTAYGKKEIKIKACNEKKIKAPKNKKDYITA